MPVAGPFRLINHAFIVLCPTARLAAHLNELLAATSAPDRPEVPLARYEVTEGVGDHLIVTIDGLQIRGPGGPDHIVDAVCTEANRRAIHSSTAPAVLHAGAVERHGRAIIVAGDSGAGKSTLVTRLLGASQGWTYLTDEAVQVTDGLKVVPYLKPLVHKGSGDPHPVGRHHVAPTTLGPLCRSATPIAGLILLGASSRTPGEQLVQASRLAFPVGSAVDCLQLLARLVAERPVVELPERPSPAAADEAISCLLAADVRMPSASAT